MEFMMATFKKRFRFHSGDTWVKRLFYSLESFGEPVVSIAGFTKQYPDWTEARLEDAPTTWADTVKVIAIRVHLPEPAADGAVVDMNINVEGVNNLKDCGVAFDSCSDTHS